MFIHRISSIDSSGVQSILTLLNNISLLVSHSRHVSIDYYYLLTTLFWSCCHLFYRSPVESNASSTEINKDSKGTSISTRKILPSKLQILKRILHSLSLCSPIPHDLIPEIIRFYNSPSASMLPFPYLSDYNLDSSSHISRQNFSKISTTQAWKVSRIRWVMSGFHLLVEMERNYHSCLPSKDTQESVRKE